MSQKNADHFGNEFPSPIGELHFSIYSVLNTFIIRRKFPSPIGELHFSIGVPKAERDFKAVSVPYRGATFLNKESNAYKEIGKSFRPLSGSYISQ